MFSYLESKSQIKNVLDTRCIPFFSSSKHFSLKKGAYEMRAELPVSFHVKWRLLSDFNQNWSARLASITFYESLFSGSRVVTCGQTGRAKRRNFLFADDQKILSFSEGMTCADAVTTSPFCYRYPSSRSCFSH